VNATGPSHLEVEIAVAKFKKYKSPRSDQIPAELIQTLASVIHKLINSLWIKEKLPDHWAHQLSIDFNKPMIQ
jgi:hypothetical protein